MKSFFVFLIFLFCNNLFASESVSLACEENPLLGHVMMTRENNSFFLKYNLDKQDYKIPAQGASPSEVYGYQDHLMVFLELLPSGEYLFSMLDMTTVEPHIEAQHLTCYKGAPPQS